MNAMEWTAVLLSLGVCAAAVGWLLSSAGRLERAQEFRFVCPRLEQPVSCRVVQNVRIGQWLRVESCSAFADPQQLTCDRECLRQANLGLPLRAARA
jgi:hypothetical protein